MNFKLIVVGFVVVGMVHGSVAQNVAIKLKNCKLEKETLTEIQNSLNFQLDFYAQIFEQKVDSTFKAVIFGSEKEFQKYSKENAKFNPVRNHSIAFYSRALNEMILHLEVDDFPKVFAHELSHAILSYYCENAAIWLDEGLAEFLEDVVLRDSAYQLDLKHREKMISVHSLFSEGHSVSQAIYARDFYQLSVKSRNYRLSYAVVYYLYNVRKEILANILRNNCGRAPDLLNRTYPQGLNLLETDLKSWFLNYFPISD